MGLAFSAPCLSRLCWLLALAALGAPPLPPGRIPAPASPRARLIQVERVSAPATLPALPGAGVRPFAAPEEGSTRAERFEIDWYANPPGVPPGAVVLLESVFERRGGIKNHVQRLPGQVIGPARAVFEIPAEEIRQSGRILKWRVRVVWRGRLLASLASPDWDG